MTLGSLFDGIGGFPLAAQHCGIEPLWASEIEPSCIEITRRHFPSMIHLGSVTDINGADIPPVDIISFGSPCQDLSIAGKQAGLDGERSGLFLEAVRIIREMRYATDGRYPAYAIWENVPGAYSSNKGEDFRRVIEALTESKIPVPKPGKWAESGLVRLSDREIAWRTFNAQYWGVPQRRKRIYLVADFRGRSAGEILFKPESLLGYTPQGGKEGQEAPSAAGSCVESAGFSGQNSVTATPEFYPECTPCLRAGVTPDCLQGVFEMSHANEGLRKTDGGICPTLQSRMGTGGNQVPFVVDTTLVLNDQGGSSISVETDISPTLRAEAHQHQPIVLQAAAYTIGNGQANDTKLHSIPGALNCMHDQQAVICRTGHHSLRWIARRLTPRECERLQGFPDDWTRYDTQDNEIKDSPRYRALGNSIAVPCAVRVFRGILSLE